MHKNVEIEQKSSFVKASCNTFSMAYRLLADTPLFLKG